MRGWNDGPALDEKIMRLIIERLEGDGKLPTEARMAADFGVSRTLLRETLRRFEANGFVVSQRGSGRRATMPDFTGHFRNAWSLVIRLNPCMMLELLDIRMLLEINALPAALERITGRQIEAMGKLIGAMKRKAARGETFVEEDQLFHRILYQTTGNQLLEQLLIAFSEVYDVSNVSLPAIPDANAVARQHEELLEALIRRDAPAAAAHLKQQLTDVRGRILIHLMRIGAGGREAEPAIKPRPPGKRPRPQPRQTKPAGKKKPNTSP